MTSDSDDKLNESLMMTSSAIFKALADAGGDRWSGITALMMCACSVAFRDIPMNEETMKHCEAAGVASQEFMIKLAKSAEAAHEAIRKPID